jgi:hypothetical protein
MEEGAWWKREGVVAEEGGKMLTARPLQLAENQNLKVASPLSTPRPIQCIATTPS